MSNNNEDDITFPSQFDFAAIGSALGCLAVLAMIILSINTASEVSSLDQAQNIQLFETAITQYKTQSLILVVLDTIFVIGYLSLFIGLWMIIRDFGDIMTQTPLVLGLLVAIGDLVENAILISLITGINNQWQPDEMIYVWLFTLNNLINILSYAAATLFAILFLMIWRPNSLKFYIGILLLAYAIIGFIAVIYPALLIARSVVFVVGLGFGTYVLYLEEDIPIEDLQELLRRDKESMDFIR